MFKPYAILCGAVSDALDALPAIPENVRARWLLEHALHQAEVGIRLAYTGAVKDDILDTETLAFHLMQMLWERYPDAVRARYKIDLPADADGVQLLEAAGRKRGFLISGGEIDLERMAKVLLEEYRSCKLGRFTLEAPEQLAQEETE